MNTDNRNGFTVSHLAAFLIGVLIFWSFAGDWLDLESGLVFLSGLAGVALAVLASGIWSLRRRRP
ncbi:MAG TPA: hypothetical protein VHO49_05870 [Anaerolineales bacterium]|nr:hypothetical protein [Anaerolineales bacterium]